MHQHQQVTSNFKRIFEGRQPIWTAGTRTVLPAWHGASGNTTVHGGRERFGNVRYMNEGGLKRKFDADEYVRMMSQLKSQIP